MITIKVDYSRASRVSGTPVLTAGMTGVELQALFSSEWEGLGKTAVFPAPGEDAQGVQQKITVLVPETGLLVIPWEVLTVTGHQVTVGFYGTNGDGSVVIPTVYCQLGVVQNGADLTAAEEGAERTPQLVEQLLAVAAEALDKAEEALAAEGSQLDARLKALKEEMESRRRVVVSANEPDDKTALWIDTSDNSTNTGEAETFNFSNSAYGFNSKGFDWDVSAVNEVYTVSNSFSVSGLRDEDGNAVPSVPHGYYGPFYKRLPVPITPGTIEVAGSVTKGYGYVTGTGASGQFVKFGLYYPQDNTEGGGYVRLIVRGIRATPVTPDTQTLLPNPVYQEAVQRVVDSWMATRKGEDKYGNPVDKRHYWYGSNWTYYSTDSSKINVWFERHVYGDESRPVVFKEYCPAMECDTFALMCLLLVPYEASPYAKRTEDGSDWYYRRKDGVNVGGTTLNYTTWSPWTTAHPDPLIKEDGTTDNLMSQMQNYTVHQYNNTVTTAGSEAWFFWDKALIFTDRSQLATGDLIFFRRYQPEDVEEWWDNVTHVGVITVEPVGDDPEAVVLNHVTDYTQAYDIDGITTDTCLHRVLLQEYLEKKGLNQSQYYFARPYTVPYVEPATQADGGDADGEG